jgi:hypothetical protein
MFIRMSVLDVCRPSKGEVFFRDPVSESVARSSRVVEKKSLEISDRAGHFTTCLASPP